MRRAIFPLLLTAVLGLAACGSSRPNTGGSTAAQNDPASSGKALAFAKCMRSHGVSNFPDPTGGQLRLQVQKTPNSTSVNGVEVNGPVFQSAMQACRSYLPNGGHPSAAQTAKVKAQALAMSRCMRSHGVPNFPDPQFQSAPGGRIRHPDRWAGHQPELAGLPGRAEDVRKDLRWRVPDPEGPRLIPAPPRGT
ncbi:MAG: hypothetical protein ACTHMY_13090 [Solirubrobacteraceae bacterium]